MHMQGFASMERVLEGMHKMAVADIVAEASVRKHVRELYTRYAVVSTGNTCMHIRAQPPRIVVWIMYVWCTPPDIKLIVATLHMVTHSTHHLCMLHIFSVMTVCKHTSHVHGDDAAFICDVHCSAHAEWRGSLDPLSSIWDRPPHP